uniref:WD_REPEATS_REGION domain-containing protein n=1 Tax=Parastrongyloides trichosuri TaxID=131310 RepID=A0A0N4Z1R2_PARTI
MPRKKTTNSSDKKVKPVPRKRSKRLINRQKNIEKENSSEVESKDSDCSEFKPEKESSISDEEIIEIKNECVVSEDEVSFKKVKRVSNYVRHFTCRGCGFKGKREDKEDHDLSCELLNISKRSKGAIYRLAKEKESDGGNEYMYGCSVKMRMEALGIDKGISKVVYNTYTNEVKRGKEKFIKEHMSNGLIDIVEKKNIRDYPWVISKEEMYLSELQEENSIRFALDPIHHESLKKDDTKLVSLNVTEAMSYKQYKDNKGDEYLQIGNVGNVASCVRTSMFTMKNDEDLIGISTFQNPNTLTSCGIQWQEEALSGIQFWTCNPTTKDSLKYRFSLQTMYGCIMDFCFSNIKPKNTDVLVYFAVAFSHGVIGIYSLPKECNKFQKAVYETSPILLLKHPQVKIYNESITSIIPYIKLSWSPFNKGTLLAAVSANDSVHLWNFEESLNHPHLSIEEDCDKGHALDVAFLNENVLCMAYYDRYNTFFDIKKQEIIYAENRPRTSGRRLTVEPHIFPSVGIYQTLLTNANDRNSYLCHVLSFDDNDKRCFSVPVYGRHQVQLNDMAFCPNTGAVVTTGSDGKVIFNLECVLIPNYAEHSRQLAMSNSRLYLVRRSYNTSYNDDSELVNEPNVKPNLTRSQCSENLYLEIHTSLSGNSKNPKLDGATLDIKIEALFRLACSQVDKNCSVYTVGEAGLLFCVTSNYKNLF